MAIDPSFMTTGPEWQLEGVGRIEPLTTDADGTTVGAPKSEGFGDMLGKQISNLQGLQEEASTQAQALATGQAEDPTAVIMAVEKAKLSMQLATQLRERGVTALQEVLRTQV